MRAITIEDLVAHIRQLRSGKTFLCNFINDCRIIDVVPMENIDKMIAEIEAEVFTDTYDGQFVGIEDVKRVINKYCKEDSNEKED